MIFIHKSRPARQASQQSFGKGWQLMWACILQVPDWLDRGPGANSTAWALRRLRDLCLWEVLLHICKLCSSSHCRKSHRGQRPLPDAKRMCRKIAWPFLSDPGSSSACQRPSVMSPHPYRCGRNGIFMVTVSSDQRSCISLEVWLCIWFRCVHFVCIVFEKISWKTRSCWWCCTVSRVFASGTWSSTYQKWNFIWLN